MITDEVFGIIPHSDHHHHQSDESLHGVVTDSDITDCTAYLAKLTKTKAPFLPKLMNKDESLIMLNDREGSHVFIILELGKLLGKLIVRILL